MVSYLPQSMSDYVRETVRPRLFATMKALGNTQLLTFQRDESNGTVQPIGPFWVLVRLGGPSGAASGGNNAISYAGVTGKLLKEEPFPVRRDDRFCLEDGSCGVITGSPTATVAYLSAPFVLEQ